MKPLYSVSRKGLSGDAEVSPWSDERLLVLCRDGNREAAMQARLELCRRYRPLILRYANLQCTKSIRDDVEASLWLLFIEAVHRYDVRGTVPFAGFVKAAVRYGHWNLFQKARRRWDREVHIPDTAEDSDFYTLTMDRIADDTDVAENVAGEEISHILWGRLADAVRGLTEGERALLQDVYVYRKSCATVARERHCSRQSVNAQLQRILKRLRAVLVTEG